MTNLKDLIYQTPEDLKDSAPKSLPPGIYYTKDSLNDWTFRKWTGVVWSMGVESLIEALSSPEEFKHAKSDGVRILGWYCHSLEETNVTNGTKE